MIAFGMLAKLSFCQVTLNLQLPATGLLVKPQLWNMSIVNSTGTARTARVQMTIADVNNSQVLLSGTSRFFQLQNGLGQYGYTDFYPVQYTLSAANSGMDRNPDGLLPPGLYQVCYLVSWQNEDGLDKAAEECETIEIEPLSPPQLVYPSDSERVQLERPVFTWTPPLPNAYQQLLYDWEVFEVFPGQLASDAVLHNLPVARQINISNTQQAYPAAAAPLDTAKLYAWHVIARNNAVPIASSEVWTFRFSKESNSTSTKKITREYILLSDQINPSVSISGDLLHFVFLNNQNLNSLKVQIFDLADQKHKPLINSEVVLPVQTGDNYLQIDIPSIARLKNGSFYLLQASNGNKKWYARFQYKKSK
jgi:hypothetical protein